MCIEKVKQINGKHVEMYYALQFESGRKEVYTAKQVKELVASKKFDFLNLQIDKAGRLVKKAVKREEVNKSDGFYMLKPTGYSRVDIFNKSRADKGWDILNPERFLEDRKEIFKKIQDKTLAEILVCRAGNDYYNLPSHYIEWIGGVKDTSDDAKLAKAITNYAKRIGIDPVKAAHKLLNWDNLIDYDYFCFAEEYSEPYFRDEDGKTEYDFTKQDVVRAWIKMAPNAYLVWNY